MKQFKRMYITSLIMVTMAFSGCGATLSVRANGDGSTSVTAQADAGAAITSLLGALYGLAGSTQTARLFDCAAIQDALEQAGYTAVSAASTQDGGTERLQASATVPATTAQDGITRTQNSLTLTVSPDIAQRQYQSLPQDAQAYIDLLMAPVFTGEPLSKAEYLDLVRSVFGSDLASELEAGTLTITLQSPAGSRIAQTTGRWQSASPSAREATFSIPLAEFLTLTTPTSCTIRW